MSGQEHLWALVLAGGDGTRLRPFTTDTSGRVTPKQYCRFGDPRSMLEWTLDRAERLVSRDRVVTVVAADHRRWWSRELAGRPPANVVVQPENRGTAVGLLLGLTQILRLDPLARVLVLPSDHYVAHEAVLRQSWVDALEALRADDSLVVLLGMTPEGYDPEYGWIVSSPSATARTRPVNCFREKPDSATAARLMERGALINGFMLVATAAALHRLYADAEPGLLGELARLAAGEAWSRPALAALYRTLPTRDFSRDVLERSAGRLIVLPVPPCGWSDLGTPARLVLHLRSRPGPRTHDGSAGSGAARAGELQRNAAPGLT